MTFSVPILAPEGLMDYVEDDFIHFEGTVPNRSGTGRLEAGGLAVFDGVMIRSRTGFAVAVRREDGAIAVRQVPFASLTHKVRALRLPLVRAIGALWEMVQIGTRALNYAASIAQGKKARRKEPSRSETATMLAASALLILVLFLFLPELFAGWTVLLLPEAMQGFASNVVTYNLLTGLFRVAILLAYVGGLSLSGEIVRVFQYHGAEHKAVLTFEQGRNVTVDRARVQDTIHPRCGTTFVTLVVLLAVVAFTVADVLVALTMPQVAQWGVFAQRGFHLGVQVVFLPAVLAVSFEMIRAWAYRKPGRFGRWALQPGLWMQRLTTRQPDDRQVEVAIVALFAALAISPRQWEERTYLVRGLEDDESAPGYRPRSPARPAPVQEGGDGAAAENETGTG